ncbi:MAG TPA: site-2 protease family protein [Longimicrobium sp.]|nr:site-2 protease family protein [Longimicrobium sp.]
MVDLVLAPAAHHACGGCGADVAAGLLSCPGCSRLLHADELRRLAAEAEAATAAGDRPRAFELWQGAMALLPPEAGQRAAISERIAALGALASVRPAQRERGGVAKATGIIGVAAAFLFKAKTIVFFLLAKGKLLLFGLTKLSTLASMGPYMAWMWALYGWKLGAGVLISIYVHEMGHVSALRFFGMSAGAPVFIPGIGALIRLKQSPPNERVDARIGLAGPVWGFAAAAAAYGVFLATGVPVWGAIARFGGWLNLFNLLPVWQLDGGRAFRSLSRRQRIGALAAIVLAFALTRNDILLLLMAGAVYQLFRPAPDRDDHGAWGTYVVLVLALAAFELLPGVRP